MTTMEDHRECDRRRVRWLRHIEDIEGTLTRRNARHEEDQEKIRELEATIAGLRTIIEGLEAKAAKPSREEQLEALEKVPAGYEVVLDPPRPLNSGASAAWCVPPIVVDRVYREGRGSSLRARSVSDGHGWYVPEEAVLELGLTAEDFVESAEAKRKKYEDMDLEEWEVELLMGANA